MGRFWRVVVLELRHMRYCEGRLHCTSGGKVFCALKRPSPKDGEAY